MVSRGVEHHGVFEYLQGELCCEDVRLSEIARRVGTPVYVYSRARIAANFGRIAAAFAPLGAVVYYAVKANANLAVLRLLRQLGAGFDVVSGGELYRVLQVGADPVRIVFAGAGKTDAELTLALESGIGQINVESEDELRALNDLAGRRGVRQRVALRVNPGVEPHTHRYISTGQAGSKFGIALSQAESLLTDAAQFSHLDIAALHIHIGSQIPDPAPLAAALDRVLPLAEHFRTIRALDIGGGFPVPYRADESVAAPEEFARAVWERTWHMPLELSIEPGRFITADAGVLVAQVQAVKHSAGRRIVVTDAGMTDLVRPALYEAYHEIVSVMQAQALDAPTDVAGPVCESADYLGRGRALPALKRGDLIAVMTAGAYGAVMASNYNSRPRAPEVVVEGKTFQVVRRRETWQDLMRDEIVE